MSETDEAKAKRQSMGLYAATMIRRHVGENIASNREPANRLCLSIDVQHGEVFAAPNANTRRANDLESACRMIAAIWPQISNSDTTVLGLLLGPYPAGRVGSNGRLSPSRRHRGPRMDSDSGEGEQGLFPSEGSPVRTIRSDRRPPRPGGSNVRRAPSPSAMSSLRRRNNIHGRRGRRRRDCVRRTLAWWLGHRQTRPCNPR
jgi:hypothetical protein